MENTQILKNLNFKLLCFLFSSCFQVLKDNDAIQLNSVQTLFDTTSNPGKYFNDLGSKIKI